MRATSAARSSLPGAAAALLFGAGSSPTFRSVTWWGVRFAAPSIMSLKSSGLTLAAFRNVSFSAG
jgi:hypothetical protein